MRHLLSDRVELPALARAWMLPTSALLALGLMTPLAAQQPDTLASIQQDTTAVAEEIATDSLVGAAVSLGDHEASLELHLSDGRTVQLELNDGIVYADGQSLGTYDEGSSLDRSWRALLDAAALASTTQLPVVLRDWEPPAVSGALGRRLDQRIEQARVGVGGRMSVAQTSAMPLEDSLEKLLHRIDELEDRERSGRHEYAEGRDARMDFVHDFGEGIAWFFATLVWFAVMFGIGAGFVFFGEGRLERVSHTVRDEPLRSWLIGIAAAFLAIPFFILVTLALAISILGIPLILAWGPLFPLMVGLAFVTGWLAVAYSLGERMVQRKLAARPRFENAGSTHYMAVGVALLLSPFLLAAMFQMTSFLEGIGALLFALALFGNVMISTMGFGAVLSRGASAWERRRDRRAAEKRALAERTAATPEDSNV